MLKRVDAERLKSTIAAGYIVRDDYPPYAIVSFEDRNRYRDYIFRIIDEQTEPEQVPELREFDVWSEGYRATGEAAPAQYLGRFKGATFRDAVETALTDLSWDRKYYDAERLTFWGCRFFDNEIDARKVFG